MDKKMKWLAEDKIAHRGYHNDKYPENSMGAFRRAVRYGFSIELDIHLLLDGVIIVFHDDNMKRLTGIDRDIEKCTYQDIKDINLFDTQEKIPLFQDVLNEIDGKVGIMVELKTRGRAGALEEKAYDMLKKYKGRYVVQSFNPLSMEWFYKNAPDIVRGQLSGYFKKEEISSIGKFALRNLLLNCLSRPDFINYDINYLDRLPIKILKRKGKFLFGWTAKNEIEYEEALKICNNVVFENFNPIKNSNSTSNQ